MECVLSLFRTSSILEGNVLKALKSTFEDGFGFYESVFIYMTRHEDIEKGSHLKKERSFENQIETFQHIFLDWIKTPLCCRKRSCL